MQGELLDEMIGMPTLFVYDLQIASKIQHKGTAVQRITHTFCLFVWKQSLSLLTRGTEPACSLSFSLLSHVC